MEFKIIYLIIKLKIVQKKLKKLNRKFQYLYFELHYIKFN